MRGRLLRHRVLPASLGLLLAFTLPGCIANQQAHNDRVLGEARQEAVAASTAAEQCAANTSDPARAQALRQASQNAKDAANAVGTARENLRNLTKELATATDARRQLEQSMAQTQAAYDQASTNRSLAVQSAGQDHDPIYGRMTLPYSREEGFTYSADMNASAANAVAQYAAQTARNVADSLANNSLATPEEVAAAQAAAARTAEIAAQTQQLSDQASAHKYSDEAKQEARQAMNISRQAQILGYEMEQLSNKVTLRRQQAQLDQMLDPNQPNSEAALAAAKQAATEAATAAADNARAAAAAAEALVSESCGSMPDFPDAPWYDEGWWDVIS